MKMKAAALCCAILFTSACAFERMPDSFQRSPAESPEPHPAQPPQAQPSPLTSIEGNWESNCSAITSANKSVRAFLKITGGIMFKYWVTYSDTECKQIERVRPIEVAGGAQKILRISEGANGMNIDLETTVCLGHTAVELDIFNLDGDGNLRFGDTINPTVRPSRFSRRIYNRISDLKFTGLLLANMDKSVGSCERR